MWTRARTIFPLKCVRKIDNMAVVGHYSQSWVMLCHCAIHTMAMALDGEEPIV